MKRARMLRGLGGGALAVTLALAALSTPAAWASPSVRHAVTYKFTASQIAWTGSRTVIAATDTHGDLDYFWQVSGSTKWHEQVVVKARRHVSFSKPAIAWTGHTVVIAALNASGGLVSFLRRGNGTWSEKLLASAGSSHFHLAWQAPAVTGLPGGGVMISDGNPVGVLDSFELAPGASKWTGQNVGSGTYGPTSITTASNGSTLGPEALITAASGGTVFLWWEYIDSPGWTRLTVAFSGSFGNWASPALAATSSSVLMAMYNTQGAEFFMSEPIGGSLWQGEAVTAGTGVSYGRPAVAWTGVIGFVRLRPVSFDVITATGPGGRLDYWWAEDGSSTWHPETIAKSGAHAAYGGPTIAASNKSVMVTAVNTKSGNLMFWYQRFDATAWHAELVAKG